MGGLNKVCNVLVAVTVVVTIVAGSESLAQDSTPSQVSFKPKKIDFHRVMQSTCRPKKVVATNISESAIQNPVFALEGSPAFRIQGRFRKCPKPLEPGDKCRFYLDFCPELHKEYEAVLKLQGEDEGVLVRGQGYAPPI